MDTTPLLRNRRAEHVPAHASSGDGDISSRARANDLRRDNEASAIRPSPALLDIHNPSLPVKSERPHKRSVLQSFQTSDLYRNWCLACPGPALSDGSLPNMNLSDTDRQSVLAILSPVQEDLQRLKASNPASLPPYNPHLRTKSHAQVLKQRLLPIARRIAAQLDAIPEETRGRLEMQLCRYIAAEYWPLPLDDFTHLSVQRMYRNALLKIGLQGQGASNADLPPESPSHNNVSAGNTSALNSLPVAENEGQIIENKVWDLLNQQTQDSNPEITQNVSQPNQAHQAPIKSNEEALKVAQSRPQYFG